MLHRQHFVHSFETQAALLVEEIGDVSLLEAGLLGQAQPGKIAFLDAPPKCFAEIILQHSKFHSFEYSTYSKSLINNVFYSRIGITTLTMIMHLTQSAGRSTGEFVI